MHRGYARHHRAPGPGGSAAPRARSSSHSISPAAWTRKKHRCSFRAMCPQHAELGWVLGCYTQFGELSRMTQFKDKSQKHADNINAGLFTYPVLMAADILLYQADLVPVGRGSEAACGACRDIATPIQRRLRRYLYAAGALYSQVGARIMSLGDPKSKMSKSDQDPDGCVYLMDKPEDIMRKFKRAVTDCETASITCSEEQARRLEPAADLLRRHREGISQKRRPNLPARAMASSSPPSARRWWN